MSGKIAETKPHARISAYLGLSFSHFPERFNFAPLLHRAQVRMAKEQASSSRHSTFQPIENRHRDQIPERPHMLEGQLSMLNSKNMSSIAASTHHFAFMAERDFERSNDDSQF
jgi:hypothetical protein